MPALLDPVPVMLPLFVMLPDEPELDIDAVAAARDRSAGDIRDAAAFGKNDAIVFWPPAMLPLLVTAPAAPVMKTPKALPVIVPVELFVSVPPSARSTPALPVPER